MEWNKIRFSLMQITYLQKLWELQCNGQKCSVSIIAALSGVTHAPVSRFLKNCQALGYVDRQNYLTQEGKQLLDRQQELLKQTKLFVRELGVSKSEQDKAVQSLMEQTEPALLELILEREERRRMLNLTFDTGKTDKTISADYVQEWIPYGRHEVEFRLFRKKENGLSLADHGFEHPAYLIKNRNGVWLELRRRRMQERSGKDGRMMTGFLETMHYEKQGILNEVDIEENALHIPLKAFQFFREGLNGLSGSVYVTVTCTVGKAHMPENTAQLVIWL